MVRRTAEEGSRVILWAALGVPDNTLHGRYTTSFRINEESDYCVSSEGKEAEGRIWVCCNLVHQIPLSHCINLFPE